MEVRIKYIDCNKLSKSHETILKFIKLLQNNFPLKDNVTIAFLGERKGPMTTGSRLDQGILKILVENRIIRDVLRTLAHEWIHEYQISVLGREKGPDIGGKNEDEANAFSGRLVKKFEKKFPIEREAVYLPFE